MIQESKRPTAAKCFAEPQVITPDELITRLLNLCEYRHHAIAMYPTAPGAKLKFENIHRIRYELTQARQILNHKEKIKVCLRLELAFQSLACSPTKKLYQSYMDKLNGYMDACRSFLGRVKQHAQ